MQHVILSTLLLFSVTSSIAGDPLVVTFSGGRPGPDAIRGGVHFQPNEGFAPARYRSIPVTCSSLVAATDASPLTVDYSGGMPDGIEDVRQVDIPDRDILTIELEYADAGADLDLILFDGTRIVAISNVDAPGRPERIVTPVSGGRYSIGVSAVEGSSAYTLRTSLSDSSSMDCEPVLELESPGRPPIGRQRAIEVTGARRRTVGLPVRPANCTYNVSPMSRTIAQAAGLFTIDVAAEPGCDWKASSNASWITLLWGSAAYGNGSAGFAVTANTGTSSRTGTLTVAGRTVSITQGGPCTYSVSPTTPQIPASGGTNTIGVTTRDDCTWSASVSATATWITIISGQSGAGNGTVTYSVAPNSSTSSRTGTMTVAGRTVSVKQALDTSSCTYAVEYTSRALSWCGGERTVRVTTQGECPWTASDDAPWITLGGTNRSGTGLLYYYMGRNTGVARQGTLTVAGTPVAITQNARTGGGTYDGIWTGMTAADRDVEFCVADGAVQDALVRVRLSFPSFSCTGPLTIYNAVPIAANAFGSVFSFPGSTISTTVRGTFTSSSAMTGSHDGFSGSYIIICGSTVGFGTGSVLSPGTYTATKQP
ncbi:MAG: BACON domain-containing protein [Thermoanaerobaculia bacterium]